MKPLLYLILTISCGVLYYNYSYSNSCQSTRWRRDCTDCCYNKNKEHNSTVECIKNTCLSKPVELKPYDVEQSEICKTEQNWTSCFYCCYHYNNKSIPEIVNCSSSLCSLV